MANIDDVLKAASDLNHTVSTECQRIEDKLVELETKVNNKINDAYFPYWRLSRNQLGTVTDGTLDYFNHTADCDLTFDVYRQIKSGISWENRDQEEQEILTAMGKEGVKHTLPEFNIIRMKWVRNPHDQHGRLFYQFVNYHGWITSGCYAKLIDGNCDGGYFEGITSKWGLCGGSSFYQSTSYIHPHPFFTSDTGEVLFCMLGTVAGSFPLDRENPKWGYIPYMQQIQD